MNDADLAHPVGSRDVAPERRDRDRDRLIQHESQVGPRPNGDLFVVTNTFSVHRRVDGVWVPFHMRHVEVSAERTTRADYQWKRIEIDQPLPDSLFTMP